MNRTLFEIGEDLRLIEATLPEVDEPEADALLQQFFENLHEEEDEKLDQYCCLIQEFRSRSKARKEEADRLRMLHQNDEAQAERLKARLLEHLQARGIKKRQLRHFVLSRQVNGGVQPLKVLVEPELLPAEYVVTRVEINSEALREQLAEREEEHDVLLVKRALLLGASGLTQDETRLFVDLVRQHSAGENDEEQPTLRLRELASRGTWTLQEQIRCVELCKLLNSPPWCYARLEERGEHVRIR